MNQSSFVLKLDHTLLAYFAFIVSIYCLFDKAIIVRLFVSSCDYILIFFILILNPTSLNLTFVHKDLWFVPSK